MLYNAACFYSRVDEKDQAIESLKNAFLAGHQNYERVKRDPDLDNIRNEPAYIELMADKHE